MPQKSLAIVLVVSLCSMCCGGTCRHGVARPVENTGTLAGITRPVEDKTKEELYFETSEDSAVVDWDEVIPVFHYWRDIKPKSYMFDVPSDGQVSSWEALCEERNSTEKDSRRNVQGMFLDMNQYVTVNDFIELWYHEDSYKEDDELTLWRLEQYRVFPDTDSEFDKVFLLKECIRSLCLYEPQTQWDMNFQSGLLSDFQKFYYRVLLKECVRYSDMTVAQALLREEEAWLAYHAASLAAFEVLEGVPSGFNGSAWPMSVSGMEEDDALMRETSLFDLLLALADGLEYDTNPGMRSRYDVKRHDVVVSDERISHEYEAFMESLGEDEYLFPLGERRDVLTREKKAWAGWMSARAEVSSLLRRNVIAKDVYDNATANVRRYKYIMLKNRNKGYGVISGDIEECLVPYSVPDDMIFGSGFDENWATLLNGITNSN